MLKNEMAIVHKFNNFLKADEKVKEAAADANCMRKAQGKSATSNSTDQKFLTKVRKI